MKWLPWPGKAERKARVRAALAEAEKSRGAARKAERLAADLREMEGDALAWAILEGLPDREQA